MITLGFAGGEKAAHEDDVFEGMYHDAAAVVMKDGEILAAVEEERLNRIKHTNCFPYEAIESCLMQAGLSWREIDFIVTNNEEKTLENRFTRAALWKRSLPLLPSASEYLGYLFHQRWGVEVRDRIRFCNHHEAHARSAMSVSGFSEALVLTIDGDGDGLSGTVSAAYGNELKTLREYRIPQSLGLFYLKIISLIGFGLFEEYKVMGLAPYGNPERYRSFFEGLYTLSADGDYSIEPGPQLVERFREHGLFALARRRGDPISQDHMDIAAALQRSVEDIVLHILKHYRMKSGLKNLCLAGGVAQNSTLNGQILRAGLFERMFVQPASYDAGGAIGACFAVFAKERPSVRPKALQHVYFGPRPTEGSDVEEKLERWEPFLEIQRPDAIAFEVAELIALGGVVGWVQGRSEFGPRALGNRSILADPRPADNKDRINAMVKKREAFRPFAPSVVAERVWEFFDQPSACCDLSFMNYTLGVREEWRSRLAAITHVDGTARLQTVSREANPEYWELLTEFGRRTGIPILLNTSFNNNREPIVNSLEDSVECFLTTGIDYLVCGRYLLRKKLDVTHKWSSLRRLVLAIPATRRLVRQKASGRAVSCIEDVKCSFWDRYSVEISEDTFSVLSVADDKATIEEALVWLGINEGGRREGILEELFKLWQTRLIRLVPPSVHARAASITMLREPSLV